MYSYEDRIQAVRLYTKRNHRGFEIVRKLGYPTAVCLRLWYLEFRKNSDLHKEAKQTGQSIHTAEQREHAARYCLAHGRRLAEPMRTLGYPKDDDASATGYESMRRRGRMLPLLAERG